MKGKRYIGFILVLLAMVCIYVIFEAQDAQEHPYYDVYIDDVQVNFCAMRTSETPYLMYPVLGLIESLGGTISWQNDTVAYLSFADRTWEFNLEHVRLTSIGGIGNLLFPPPGSTEGVHIIKSKRDAYVDTRTLEHLLWNYLYVRKIDIDDAQQVVRLYTK